MRLSCHIFSCHIMYFENKRKKERKKEREIVAHKRVIGIGLFSGLYTAKLENGKHTLYNNIRYIIPWKICGYRMNLHACLFQIHRSWSKAQFWRMLQKILFLLARVCNNSLRHVQSNNSNVKITVLASFVFDLFTSNNNLEERTTHQDLMPALWMFSVCL